MNIVFKNLSLFCMQQIYETKDVLYALLVIFKDSELGH